MNNQFTGSNFEGTPISQLMNDNGMMGMASNDFGNFPPVTNPNQNNMNQPAPNMMFQQPSRDIRNMVHNINNRLENDFNNVRDNVSFDLSNQSMDSSSSKKQFIKYMKNKQEADEKLKKKLKKLKKKKMKELEENKNEDDTDEEEKSDYIAFYNIGKHLNKDTKELLLLVLIYCILSLGFIKKTVGGYISYINPDETGKYSYVGVIIYGFLLSILFISLRKITVG